MGIRGLTTYVQKKGHLCTKEYKLHDCELVIDGDSTAYQLYNNFSPKNCCFTGDYDRYGDVIRSFFQLLMNCKIIPYIIFDGGYEKRKMGTILKRMKDRIRTAAGINSTTNGILFPLFLGETFRDIAVEFNIRVIRCDYEGDLEAAKIAKCLNCPVLSSDSDFYIFGVLYIPFTTFRMRTVLCLESQENSVTKKTYKYIPCKIYRTDDFLTAVGLRKDMLPVFAVLLGNDYISRNDFEKLFRTFGESNKFASRNNQYNLIDGLLNFLHHETKDSAIEKVLGVCNNMNKPEILNIINDTINGYIIEGKVSEYIGYLERDSKLSATNSVENITLNSYLECKTIPPDILVTFLSRSRKGLYPSCFINMLLENTYHIRPQVDDTSQPNSHIVSIEIISAIHKILTHSPAQLQFFSRVGSELGEQLLPIFPSFVPNISEIQVMDVESRQQILISVLSVDQKFVENCLNLFPKSWTLYILAIKYLTKRTVLNWQFIYSLILCKIVISYVDKKVGRFIRSTEILMRDFKKEICHFLINRKSVSLSDNIIDAVMEVSYDESLIALKNLLQFFQVNSKIKTSPLVFNRTLVHTASQFQSCLIHIKFLNYLLNSPFENCVISQCFNGTFIYNLTNELLIKSQEDYVSVLLQNSSSVLNCFNMMVGCLKSHLNL